MVRNQVFCIDNKTTIKIIVPIVAVEVKTFLDATMFGEVKSSSKSIGSSTPNSKTYVLMGYKELADEHIISARQDSALTEMFALRDGSRNGDFLSPIKPEVLFDYWNEIHNAVASITCSTVVPDYGRLLNP